MSRQLDHRHRSECGPSDWDRKFRLIDYDVTDYIHVSGQVDYVMNFASPASPVDYLKWPIHTLKVGSFGTHKGFAYEKGAVFFLASTSEVYGDPS